VPGIQLAHAGRKGSASRPWEGDAHLEVEQGGWQTIAPSAMAFGGALSKVPTAMTTEDIARVQRDFVVAAERSLAAGFEWLELHFAHGYLAHEFYSPLSNHRTDAYGGSFENRTRFLRETFSAVRKVWPERLPLTVRLSVTDWQPEGVTVEESIELVQLLQAEGLDLLDVSHGFVTPDISVIPWAPGFMAPIAAKLRSSTKIPIAVGWMITEPKQAEEILERGEADLILLARELLRDPYWPYHAALALEDPRSDAVLPVQYARAVKRR
jgi:2,4-dienoyl-CoA reductase-like NADH-dependent reductase (Old Yellow Enzyme family)